MCLMFPRFFLFSFLDLPCSIRRVSYDPLPMSLSTNRADVCFELQQQLKQQTKPGFPFAAVFLCLFPVVHFPPLPFPPQPSFPPPCLSVSESLSQTTLSEAVWGRGRGGSLFGSLSWAATLSLPCAQNVLAPHTRTAFNCAPFCFSLSLSHDFQEQCFLRVRCI